MLRKNCYRLLLIIPLVAMALLLACDRGPESTVAAVPRPTVVITLPPLHSASETATQLPPPSPMHTPDPSLASAPPPSSTPSHPLTPTADPELWPGLYLDWFGSETDGNYAIAAKYIKDIWDVDPELGAVVAQFRWVGDDLTVDELRLLHEIAVLSGKDLAFTWKILDYHWIADDVTNLEAESLAVFRSLLEDAAGDSESLETLVGFAWVYDGIIESEVKVLHVLHGLLAAANNRHTGLTKKLLSYHWTADGIAATERNTLAIFQRMLETADTGDLGFIESLAEYAWVSDGITGTEGALLDSFRHMLETDIVKSSLLNEMASYSWISDGVTAEEKGVLDIFRRVLDASQGRVGLLETLARYPWVSDGVTKPELEALEFLRFSLERGVVNISLLETLAGYPWVSDGITTVEMDTLSGFITSTQSEAESGLVSMEELLANPWAKDGISDVEGSAIGSAISLVLEDPELAQQPWFADGVDDVDLAFLAVLKATKDRSEFQYRDLLESHHVRSKTISLPLAGDADLLVFRHNPFPPDDDSLEVVEEITLALEEFMVVPFPRNPVILSIIEPSIDSGEKPGNVIGFSLHHLLMVAVREYNPGFDLTIMHEVSHIYWGGHTGAPPWFTEGAAGLLPAYVKEISGVQFIDGRRDFLLDNIRLYCLDGGVRNIRKMLELKKQDPMEYQARDICNYAFGELFMLETYRLLGHDATSAAMRELYLEAEATDWTEPISEEGIYQAFLSNAQTDKKDAFREMYDRIHGGVPSG